MVATENYTKKRPTRKNKIRKYKIEMERQGKGRSQTNEARRRLEGIIIRKGKPESNMLNVMVSKAEIQAEEKEETISYFQLFFEFSFSQITYLNVIRIII